MLTVRIETRGLKEAEQRASELAQGGVLQDFDFEAFVPAIIDTVEQIFDSSGSGRWPPLSEQYERWKERNYPGQPLLVLTERLRNAATTPGAANNTIRITDDSIFFGVSEGIPYARIHEFGDDRRNIPARPIFGLAAIDDELEREVTRIMENYLDQLDF